MGGHQPFLLEVEGVAYNKAYPIQDIPIIPKVYSNKFDYAAHEEALKFLAVNICMAYVVDQAQVVHANLDHGGIHLLFLL